MGACHLILRLKPHENFASLMHPKIWVRWLPRLSIIGVNWRDKA